MPTIGIKYLVCSRTKSVGNTRVSPHNDVVPRSMGRHELGPCGSRGVIPISI